MEDIDLKPETFLLSEDSTKEEVADYIYNELIQKEEVKNIFINEYITGDVLPLLTKEELLSLNIKLGPSKKISKFIEDNKSNFRERKINIKLYSNSSEEEIKNFMKKYLEFEGHLNNLDGKRLLQLNEEGMKKLGLKYGQRKRLIKYINHFNTLKSPAEEIKDISISKKSKEKEVSEFLKLKLNFSEECIKELGLDGETLFDLTDDEIDNIKGAGQEQKEKLKLFIKGVILKTNQKEIKEEKIKLNRESLLEEVIIFLKIKLNFSDESIEFIKEKGINGKILLDLNDKDIENLKGISNNEKLKLKIFLNDYNNRQKKYEISKPENKGISQALETKLEDNNKEQEKKEQIDIKYKEEKQNQKEIQNKNEKVTNIEYIIKKANDNKKKGDIVKNSLNIEEIINQKNNIDNNNSHIKINKQRTEKSNFKVEISDKLKFYSFKNMEVNSLENFPYNIFFFISLTDIQSKTAELSTYVDNSGIFSVIYYNYKSNLISKTVYRDNRDENYFFYLFEIPCEKPLKNISISIKKNKNDVTQYNSIIYTNNNENYFHLNNLECDKYNNFIPIDTNFILSNYLDYFCNNDVNIDENIQKCLIKSIISKISNEYGIKISSSNFFRILKYCLKFEIKTKNFENLEVIYEKIINFEYYITEEEISKIETISKKKSKIIDLIVISYLNSDSKYLFKLIKGNMSTCICRSILDLMQEGHIKIDELLSICDNNEELYLFLKFLLHKVNSRKDLEMIINFKKGLLNSLIFIRDNIEFLMTLESGFFPIKLDFPTDKDDINELFRLVNYIINEFSKKKYTIINIEEIFDNLINLYSNKNLDELCKLYNFIPFIYNNKKRINDFYNKIHTKGFDLIKNNKLTTSEIFNFILCQDAYYFSPTFCKSEYRNPEIFKYISITKKNKNDSEYLKNIDIIKKNKLYLLFSNSSSEIQKKFQKILLDQIKK